MPAEPTGERLHLQPHQLHLATTWYGSEGVVAGHENHADGERDERDEEHDR